MKLKILFTVGCLTLAMLNVSYAQALKKVNEFSLMATTGKQFSFNDHSDAKGYIVVFTSNNCPFAKLYPKRLIALENKYSQQQVELVAIRSTDTTIMLNDCFEKMQQLALQEEFNFPFLADNNQEVAQNFGAQKTPHAFVIWKENNEWIVKYTGAIDDNGAEPEKVKHAYIEEAVDALLNDKEVKVKSTKSVGCAIHFRNIANN
jgi:alkyl hydroperoxide reductase subunit AhpC